MALPKGKSDILRDLLTWICDCVYSECVVYRVCYLSLLAVVWIVHEVEGSIRRIICQTSNLIAVLPLHTRTHTNTHAHRFDYAVINEAVWAWRRLTDLFVVTMCRGEAETLGINDRGGRREETKLERGRNNKRADRTEKKTLTPAALQPQTLKSDIHLTSLFPWPPTSLSHLFPILYPALPLWYYSPVYSSLCGFIPRVLPTDYQLQSQQRRLGVIN